MQFKRIYYSFNFRAFAAWEEKIPINVEAKNQLIPAKSQYKCKLIVDQFAVLKDPLTLPQKEWLGEQSGGLQKWPPIYHHDISNYLEGINTPSDFLHRLNCDYKEGKSYRFVFNLNVIYHFSCCLKKIIFPKIFSSRKNVFHSIFSHNPLL